MREQANASKKGDSPNIAKANLKEFEEQTEIRRIIDKNEKWSFRVRLKSLRWFVMVAVVLLLVWSATTESLFLFSGLYEMTASIIISVLGILLFVFLLEGGKYFFGGYLIRFFTQGWLKDGALYFVMLVVLAPVTFGLFWGSYYLSVNGAPQIAKFIRGQTYSPNLIDIDSIESNFDSRIALLQSEIGSAKKIKWRGTTTNTATKLALGFQSQINELEEQKRSAIEDAKHQNNQQLYNDEMSTTNWGGWLSKFGGFGELLTIVFLIFLELYDRASYVELSSDSTTPNTLENNSNNSKTPNVQQPVANETEENKELEELRAIIFNQKVDARYLKQRAKQCFKRSFKENSSKEAKQRNLEKSELFIQKLSTIGISTKVDPQNYRELIFFE